MIDLLFFIVCILVGLIMLPVLLAGLWLALFVLRIICDTVTWLRA